MVTYSLGGSQGQRHDIYLYVSQDGGESFPTEPITVSGDTGPGVQPGSQRRIVWDVLNDIPKLQSDQFVVMVTTSPLKEITVTSPPGIPKQTPARQTHQIPRPKTKPAGRPERNQLVMQSMLFPGWGQASVGKNRGYLYMLGCTAGAGAAYWAYTNYEDTKKKYYAEQTLSQRVDQPYPRRQYHYNEMMERRKAMNFYLQVNWAALVATGIIYGLNVIDMGSIDLEPAGRLSLQSGQHQGANTISMTLAFKW